MFERIMRRFREFKTDEEGVRVLRLIKWLNIYSIFEDFIVGDKPGNCLFY